MVSTNKCFKKKLGLSCVKLIPNLLVRKLFNISFFLWVGNNVTSVKCKMHLLTGTGLDNNSSNNPTQFSGHVVAASPLESPEQAGVGDCDSTHARHNPTKARKSIQFNHT